MNEFLLKIKALIFDYATLNSIGDITCGEPQSVIRQIEEVVQKINSVKGGE